MRGNQAPRSAQGRALRAFVPSWPPSRLCAVAVPRPSDRGERLGVAVALDLHQDGGEAAALGRVAHDLDALLVEPLRLDADLDLDLLAGTPRGVVELVDQEAAERPVLGREGAAVEDHD